MGESTDLGRKERRPETSFAFHLATSTRGSLESSTASSYAMTLPSTRSSDPPPPLNAVRQLLNSLRTSGQTWVALLALLLAYGTYRRAGSSSGLGFGDKLAGKTLEERKDPLGSGGVEDFPPLDELDDRGRLWPPDLGS